MLNQNFIPAFPLRLKEIDSQNINESAYDIMKKKEIAHEIRQKIKFNHSKNNRTKCIHHLNWINCFIGANNSGKSRALRAMFKSITPQYASTFKLGKLKLEKIQVAVISNLLDLDISIDENIKDLITPSFYIYDNYASIYTFWERLDSLLLNEEAMSNFANKLITNKNIIQVTELNNTHRSYINNKKNLDINYQETAEFRTELESLIQDREKIFMIKDHINKVEQLALCKIIERKPERLEELEKELLTIQNRIMAIEKEMALRRKSNPYFYNNFNNELSQLKTKEVRLSTEISKLKEINQNELPQLIANIEALNLPSKDQLQSELELLDLKETESEISRIEELLNKLINNQRSKLEADIKSLYDSLETKIVVKIKEEIKLIIEAGLQTLEVTDINISKLYIPILRGTRPLSGYTDVYADRTQKDYGISPDYVFTGLSLYTELQKHLLGTHAKRELIRDFEKFLSESFFDNQEVVLIPNIGSDVVYIKIGNKELPIYELGDGVQALIILTFPLFLRKKEEWAIFIEEPEAHLHPKWQRFFIETIKKHFPKHQFFITSHSNVFLNTEDVSVYRVYQDTSDSKTAIEYIDTQHTELLDDLGYKASDLLNANYIIWVEGASDKIYIKQFITAYDKNLIEGIHYSIMFYGGCSNLIKHINISSALDTDKVNILALNPKCGFIVDSDLESADIGLAVDTDGKDKLAFQQKCTNEGHFCWITQTREIENLIPLTIWKEAAVQYAYTKDNRYDSSMTNSSKVIFDSTVKDINFNDRTGKKKGTLIKMNNNTDLRVNDKIKMAKEVVKLFPKDKTHLSSVPELEENIARLVEEIKKANLVEDTIEEETQSS